MEAITQLFKLDVVSIIIGIFIILSAIISMITIVSKFMEYIGKPIKWVKGKDKDHELLLCTNERLDALQKQREEDVEQSIKHDKAISDDLKSLTDMFIDKQIEDWRWEIINFSTKVAEGKPCNKDGYVHCLKIYERYEKFITDHGMENGEVDISAQIVKESYKEKLKNGF